MGARKRQSGICSRRDLLRFGLTTGVGLALPAAQPAWGQTGPRPLAPSFVPLHLPRVHLNQVGYRPHDNKRAIVVTGAPPAADDFHIIDDDPISRTRHRGVLTPLSAAGPPGLLHLAAEFDVFTQPGRYRLRLADGALSPPFTIADDLYTRLVTLPLEFYDIQRCGSPNTVLQARCHADDGIAVGGPRNGQPIDATGGWHDAGDYLKLVETASFVAAVMLYACDRFSRQLGDRQPRKGSSAILDHARTGIEWLLKMHPTPAEFYYQVGDESDHEEWRLPSQDCVASDPKWVPRKVFHGVGANIAGRTAAALALASRLYRTRDASFASTCLIRAESAYKLGTANPRVVSSEPFDFYPEKTWADDMEWGAVELFRATRRREYLEQALGYSRLAGPAKETVSVYNVHALAHASVCPFSADADRARLKEYLLADADRARQQAEADAYGLGAPYRWGTADTAVGAALSCLLAIAAGATDADGVLASSAARQRDYVLGCNPFDRSFVIGAGAHYPLFPHHQVADLKKQELFGAMVGGPADYKSIREEQIDMAGAKIYTVDQALPGEELPDDAPIYEDRTADYVTNEPAIDYTAKFLLLCAFYCPPDQTSARGTASGLRGRPMV